MLSRAALLSGKYRVGPIKKFVRVIYWESGDPVGFERVMWIVT